MNTTIILLAFIAVVISVAWGTKFKTNVGVVALVFAFLLKGFGNLNLIWGAFVLAELCGIPLAAALWKRKGEKQIQF